MAGDGVDIDHSSAPKGKTELTQDLSLSSSEHEKNFEGFQEPRSKIPEGTAALEIDVAAQSDEMADDLQIDKDYDLDGLDI